MPFFIVNYRFNETKVDEVGNETPSMKRTTERLKMKVVHRDSDDDDDDKSSLFSMESEEEFKARINSFNENNHGLYLKLVSCFCLYFV